MEDNMKKELYFFWYAIKKNIQSSAELRASFLMNILGMFINNISFVLIWLFLIKVVGDIGGWTSAYIFGLQGFTALSYGIVFSAFYEES
jgi:ABC-2 type transport system permease protein